MNNGFPSWHPLSEVSEARDECECHPKQRTIGIEIVNGAPAYICQECNGYVD